MGLARRDLGGAPVTVALVGGGLTIVFLALYVLSRRHDPRMIRNGVILTVAILLGIGTTVALLVRAVPGFAVVIGIGIALVPVAIVLLGVALLANGVRMFRREGRSLGNLLSLIAGVLVFALPTIAVLLWTSANGTTTTTADVLGVAVAVLLVFVSGYVALAFVAFAVYSVVYARMRQREAPDAIIVLGSGLVRGEVPPLLRSRLDRALHAYRGERSAGRRPVLVPSGGQGSDEPRAEGAAMAEYLLANGADAGDVLPETESRTTRENLELSRRVLADAGRTGPILVVTSNYHVLRAATLARKAGLPAQVIGSPTAAYYVPSAFLREFVAVIVENRWLNVVAVSPLVLFTAFLLWESFQQH